ncbi:TetR family transcriptional regulator [Paenibacillus shenyangensis]|uniref:TetR family transcriptional regulator n=1 Tax=Paenibacillus sp. A9 TaxID=1284352 RepID=UPI00056C9C67|nr:TetR family transcriptional regulator [Paenibacillus sp. A9]
MASDLPLTKENILDAAEQVLRRYGPDKTSVVDVARVLKVSHGTIYRHYPSKAALREAVTERWLHTLSDPLERIARETGGSELQRLRHWYDTLIQNKRRYAVEDAEMFAMYAAVSAKPIPIITEHIREMNEQIASILRRGMDSGEIAAGDPAITARALFNATSYFHHPAHAAEWVNEEIDRYFDEVWMLLCQGVQTSS